MAVPPGPVAECGLASVMLRREWPRQPPADSRQTAALIDAGAHHPELLRC